MFNFTYRLQKNLIFIYHYRFTSAVLHLLLLFFSIKICSFRNKSVFVVPDRLYKSAIRKIIMSQNTNVLFMSVPFLLFNG